MLPANQILNHQLDIRLPIQVVESLRSKSKARGEYNETLLRERYHQCRKTVIRLVFEVYGRRGARQLTYIPLQGESLMLACPTPSQAKAAIRMIQDVIMSLNGKLLDESILDEVK